MSWTLKTWGREQETLYILQNESLAKQIAKSIETLRLGGGHPPSEEELNAIDPR